MTYTFTDEQFAEFKALLTKREGQVTEAAFFMGFGFAFLCFAVLRAWGVI